MKEELSLELESSDFKTDVLALPCPWLFCFWSMSPLTSFSVNKAQSEICALFGGLVDNFQQNH